VDDEPVLAQLGLRTIERLGYRATAVTVSPKALELVRSDPASFDLVLTDYTMPHLTGTALARAIHDVRPGLPVVMMSGYSEGIDPESLSEAGVAEVIGKPVTTDMLAEVLHRHLAAGGVSAAPAGGRQQAPPAVPDRPVR
jgi:two-component system cell cycle sensor histidine kinase/response regulator CckA